MAVEFVKRHINKLAPEQIFTTRELLIYGTRSAVDAALSRLVRLGIITRLARGVFVRELRPNLTIEEIARAKAVAFRKKIHQHPELAGTNSRQVREHEGRSTEEKQSVTYLKGGHSSSFATVRGRVYLKGVCERKLHMLQNKVSQAALVLWQRGRRNCKSSDVSTVATRFNRQEKFQFWLTGASVPQWLQELCAPWFPRPQLII